MKTTATIIQMSILTAICLILILPLGNCKNFGSPDYTLTITFDEGVEGTPLPGSYGYDELAAIPYEYKATDGLSPVYLEVNDSARWSSTGTFNMYADLTATVKLLDIRGSWEITMVTTSTSADDTEFTAVFSGDNLYEGTVTDSGGYHAAWKYENDTITITYSDWKNFILTGPISTMRGTWAGDDKSGTWSSKFVSE